MNTLIKIAWRNLWRNKRRTLITAGSVFLAVVLSLFTRSMQMGTYGMMIDASVKEVGYIQVHDSGFWNNQSINNSFVYTEEIKSKITEIETIKQAIPRLESFALGSFGEQTKGLLIQGIDPEKEDPRKIISEKLKDGRFITADDQGIILAEGLAKFLKIGVNDTLVILGQGYQGITVANIFSVAGIVKYGAPQINNTLMYMGIKTAQETFAPYHPNLVTSVVIDLEDADDKQETINQLQNILGGDFEIMGWDDMLTEVVQQIESDNAGGIVMLAILYIIVAFGILGTILMMTMERRKEFAIMVSVGMRREKLSVVVITETILIGLLGVIIGILVSVPFLNYLHLNPIPMTGEMANMMNEFNIEPVIPFAVDSFVFTNQGIAVLIITLLVAIYPLAFVNRFKILKAMRG